MLLRLMFISMKVLIAGSSGLIGKALSASLVRKGFEVKRLLRPNSTEQNGLVWNPLENKIEIQSESFDAVINLAGANIGQKRWTAERKKQLYTSRVDSTQLLASALANANKPPKVFLNASAIGIYGERGDEILTELSPGGSGFLADLCKDWEKAAHKAAEVGIRTAVLRIGLVTGPDANFLKRQKLLFNLGLGGWIGSPGAWLSWVALSDAVKAIEWLMENESISGPVNITSPAPSTAKGFAKTLGKAMRRPVFLPIPKFGPSLLLGREMISALFQSTRVEPAVLLENGFEFQFRDPEAALAEALGR